MLVLLISSSDEYDSFFSSEDKNFKFHHTNELEQARYYISSTNYDVIFINVKNNDMLDKYVGFVKEWREKNVWIPVCYITNLPVMYEDLVKKTDGYNCITMIDSRQDDATIKKQIDDVLFIVSDEGKEVLNNVQEAIKNVNKKIDETHASIIRGV